MERMKRRMMAMVLAMLASAAGLGTGLSGTPAYADATGTDAAAPSAAGDGAKADGAAEASADAAEPTTAEGWLDRLEAHLKGVKTMRAKVRWDRIQGLLGDEQRRFGTVTYVAGPPARFAMRLDRLFVDGQWREQDRSYVFDGTWLVERITDQKQFFKRQVVSPQAKAAGRDDPLGMGSGPFVIPITPDKARLLARFEVTLEPTGQGEPQNSVHLKLVPRGESAEGYTEVRVWYDRTTLLPVRARTVDDSENESIVHLREMVVDEEVGPEVMDTSEPTETGWHVEITPWEG